MNAFCTMLALLLATLGSAAAQTPLTQESAAQEALEEARRVEAEALRRLFDAHDRVGQLADPSNPQKARAGSNEKIVNGLLTSRFPTTGAFLHINADGSFGSHCTGTLVGCSTFLTARHCVASTVTDGAPAEPSEYKNYRVFLQHAGIFEVDSIATRDDYAFPLADVAVIRLKSAVNGVTPTPLYTGGPIPNGTEGTIAGFGRSGGLLSDYGLKRTGFVRTAECADKDKNLVCWDYEPGSAAPGEASNTCNADSGGPLFIEDLTSNPPRRVLAGVTSGGTQSSCLTSDHSYDVDVRQYAEWIDEQVSDPLAPAACGDLKQWGSDGVVVRRVNGSLSAAEKDARYTIDVPSGTKRFRVAMNAEDSFGKIDFDLFVRRGSEPTEAQADCKQVSPSQYAFCDFPNPAVGTWHIWVKQRAGSGLYQVTASTFGS